MLLHKTKIVTRDHQAIDMHMLGVFNEIIMTITVLSMIGVYMFQIKTPQTMNLRTSSLHHPIIDVHPFLST